MTDPETGDFGLNVSSFLGAGLSPEVAEHVEQSIAAALSAAAGEPVEVSGARLDGTKVHVNARMSRGLAEDLGLVEPLPAGPLFGWGKRTADPLLRESVVTVHEGGRFHILCPSSATFDAAEALRLELVAAAPPGVSVDVEIAEGGGGSAEDEAGRRLFASRRAARLAGCGCSSLDLGECSTCSPEHEAYCNGFACAGCNPPTACACHGGTA